MLDETFEKWWVINGHVVCGTKSQNYFVWVSAQQYAAPTQPSPQAELVSALRNLLSYAERNTCYHEETHRGGAIWEICDSCGAKWADDMGGKPEFSEPEEIKAACAALAKLT